MNQTKDWISNTNVYEVNLRQYTPEGTFNAFSGHLPRLKDMGVHTLWFMPVTPIAQKNKKGSLGSYYACSDYTSINPEFGTLEDFKQLVGKAQGMGFKVIIDWVANHTGWDHHWTVDHPEWYEKDEETGDFKKASGMDDIIELDFSNSEMRLAMINAMRFWVEECHIDGFRCDLAFWVELDFWIQAKAELDKIKSLFWLAEADPLEHPEYMLVFDAAYTWAWMHRTRDFYEKHLPLHELTSILERYHTAPGIKAWFTSNHDENSWNGTEYEKYGSLAKTLAVFSCTWPGLPLIYSGQELPNMKRLEFFEKDVIDWRGHYRLHGFYKTLLQLRTKNKAFWTDGKIEHVPTGHEDKILAFKRSDDGQEFLILLNFSGHQVDVSIKGNGGEFLELFSGEYLAFSQEQWLRLHPWQYMLFESKRQ
jgi:glycosidase